MLHEAAHAALENETRYFFSLLRIGFPLYGEDGDFDFAAFYICNTDKEATFLNCLTAIMKNGFDINRENEDDESFLQRLCLSPHVSQTRVRAMLKYRPEITEDHL